jgi:hypothetical protein
MCRHWEANEIILEKFKTAGFCFDDFYLICLLTVYLTTVSVVQVGKTIRLIGNSVEGSGFGQI